MFPGQGSQHQPEDEQFCLDLCLVNVERVVHLGIRQSVCLRYLGMARGLYEQVRSPVCCEKLCLYALDIFTRIAADTIPVCLV